MTADAVLVECRDCAFAATFSRLGRARVALADHGDETGHDVDWEIRHTAAGLQQAGADAGVCGQPDCANADSPLVAREPDATDGE